MHLSSVNWRARLVVTTLALGSFFSPITIRAGETALDRYVKKPDATYAWKVLSTVKAAGTTQFVVELISQTWLAPKEVDRPVWKHWLVITKPDNATAKTAFLFIGGGGNGGNPPTGADARTLAIAKATGGVTAELKMVPNQTLEFFGDGVKRNEDDLIGFTWDYFLKTGNETWPARLPMVKSTVRAMFFSVVACLFPVIQKHGDRGFRFTDGLSAMFSVALRLPIQEAYHVSTSHALGLGGHRFPRAIRQCRYRSHAPSCRRATITAGCLVGPLR